MLPTIRVATWNVHCGVFSEATPTRSADIAYIAECLRAISADVVCLQEFRLPEDIRTDLEHLQRDAGYSYARFLKLDRSHLGPGNTGLLILSRLPCCEVSETIFPNPKLAAEFGGIPFQSHNKGALRTTLEWNGGQIDVVNLHLYPFELFNVSPLLPSLDPTREALKRFLCESNCKTRIVCGDLNVSGIDHFVPNACETFNLREVIHQPTRPTGRAHDQILHSGGLEALTVRVLHTLSDHHACIAEVRGIQGSSTAKRAPSASPVSPTADKLPVCILHLSDLHFGPGETEPGEWKTRITYAERETQREGFINFIRAGGLPRRPDFVVISGDVTVRGGQEGWNVYLDTIDPLIAAGRLPSADRFVLVPGNHDVTRTQLFGDTDEKARWIPFVKALGSRHPRAWIPAVDPAQTDMLNRARESMAPDLQLWGGVRFETDPLTNAQRITNFPFVFDRSLRVLIYAFNSASVSGSTIELSPATRRDIDQLQRGLEGKQETAFASVLKALEQAYETDPSRIDPRERSLFGNIMAEVASRDESDLADVLKIAVLHHHVTSIFPEEVKNFETLLNAGLFKRQLRDQFFHLILHGHKHWGESFVDSAISGGGAHIVVAGGTIAGPPQTGCSAGFHWLEWGNGTDGLSVRFIDFRSSTKAPEAFQAGRLSNFAMSRDSENGQLRVSLPGLDSAKRINLLPVFREVEDRLFATVRSIDGQKNGPPLMGWTHRLKSRRALVSTIATAYGLKVLAITSRESARVAEIRRPVIGALMAMRRGDGGWSSSSQNTMHSQPEATCWVLEGLSAWSPDSSTLDEATSLLENMLSKDEDGPTAHSTFSGALALRVLSRLRPTSAWTKLLADRLVDGAVRHSNGDLLCWGAHLNSLPEKPNTWGMDSSPIHTAHAALALLAAQQAGVNLKPHRPEWLTTVRRWLLCQPWEDCEEQIQRLVKAGTHNSLTVNHFTAPWAIIASLRMGETATDTRIATEVRKLFDCRVNGLWDWGRTEAPVWATHDALLALYEAALAGVASGDSP